MRLVQTFRFGFFLSWITFEKHWCFELVREFYLCYLTDFYSFIFISFFFSVFIFICCFHSTRKVTIICGFCSVFTGFPVCSLCVVLCLSCKFFLFALWAFCLFVLLLPSLYCGFCVSSSVCVQCVFCFLHIFVMCVVFSMCVTCFVSVSVCCLCVFVPLHGCFVCTFGLFGSSPPLFVGSGVCVCAFSFSCVRTLLPFPFLIENCYRYFWIPYNCYFFVSLYV